MNEEEKKREDAAQTARVIRELAQAEEPRKEGGGGLVHKLATLGGGFHFNKKNAWLYQGSKKRDLHDTYGIPNGPIHFGMPYKKGEMADIALHSDSKLDIIKELVAAGLSRREAEKVIQEKIKSGEYMEVDSPDFGKILVRRKQ